MIQNESRRGRKHGVSTVENKRIHFKENL